MTRLQRLILVAATLVVCTGVDQATKVIARQTLAGTPTRSLLGDLLRIHYTENSGAFLSLGANLPDGLRFAVFTVLAGLVLLATIVYTLKDDSLSFWPLTGLSLLAAGGVGNLIDRLLHEGRVVDFLNLGIGPLRTGIFNVADLWIVAGAILFAFFSLRRTQPNPPP